MRQLITYPPGGGSSADEVTVGTTAVNNATDGYVLINDNGVLGELPYPTAAAVEIGVTPIVGGTPNFLLKISAGGLLEELDPTTYLTPAQAAAAYQPLDATLTALSAYNTNGLLTQTAANTFTGRTISGTANQISVADGDGVAGNPTLSLPADVIIPTVLTVPNTGLHLLDTNASHDLIIKPGSDITADRTLTLTTGDADRTITLSGNPTLADWFDQSVKTTANPQFATIELGAASDTTLSRASAGVLAVEGVNVLTTATGQPLDATLTALAAYNTNGLITQTAADTFTGRTITGTANQIGVANGNGVGGNPTLSLPADVIIPTVLTVPNTGLHLLDTNASHDLIIKPGSDVTADRTLTLTTGDADRTITLSGNPTLADWFDQSVKTTANPQFATIELGAASDTTLSRVSAGVVAIEGVTILTTATGQPLDATLTALAAYNTNGLITQTAADTFTGRTITGTANQITVADGNGVAGNPILSFPSDVIIPTVLTVPNTGLHLLDTNASHDLIVKPGSNITADRTLTITTGDTDMILDLTAVTDEFVLAYDTGTNTWRGVAASGGGIPTIGSSTDNAIVRWNGAGGNAVQDSDWTIDDDGNMDLIGNLAAILYSSITNNNAAGYAANYLLAGTRTFQFLVGAADNIYATGTGAPFLVGTTDANEVYFLTNNLQRLTVLSSGEVGIGTTSPDRKFHVENDSATTNAVTYVERLTSTSSGTPAAGIGVGMEFEIETAAGNNEVGATVQAVAIGVGSGSEVIDLQAVQMAAGALQDNFGLSFLLKSLTSNAGYTNNNTVQSWFSSGGSLTVPGSTSYEFEGLLLQTNGTTSHTVGLSFGGTATLTSIAYIAMASAGLVNATVTAQNTTMVTQAANTVVTAAITTAGTQILVKGIVRINAGGTFIPQFTFSAAPGAGNNLANTFFKMRKIGTNTTTTQGPWA